MKKTKKKLNDKKLDDFDKWFESLHDRTEKKESAVKYLSKALEVVNGHGNNTGNDTDDKHCSKKRRSSSSSTPSRNIIDPMGKLLSGQSIMDSATRERAIKARERRAEKLRLDNVKSPREESHSRRRCAKESLNRFLGTTSIDMIRENHADIATVSTHHEYLDSSCHRKEGNHHKIIPSTTTTTATILQENTTSKNASIVSGCDYRERDQLGTSHHTSNQTRLSPRLGQMDACRENRERHSLSSSQHKTSRHRDSPRQKSPDCNRHNKEDDLSSFGEHARNLTRVSPRKKALDLHECNSNDGGTLLSNPLVQNQTQCSPRNKEKEKLASSEHQTSQARMKPRNVSLDSSRHCRSKECASPNERTRSHSRPSPRRERADSSGHSRARDPVISRLQSELGAVSNGNKSSLRSRACDESMASSHRGSRRPRTASRLDALSSSRHQRADPKSIAQITSNDTKSCKSDGSSFCTQSDGFGEIISHHKNKRVNDDARSTTPPTSPETSPSSPTMKCGQNGNKVVSPVVSAKKERVELRVIQSPFDKTKVIVHMEKESLLTMLAGQKGVNAIRLEKRNSPRSPDRIPNPRLPLPPLYRPSNKMSHESKYHTFSRKRSEDSLSSLSGKIKEFKF